MKLFPFYRSFLHLLFRLFIPFVISLFIAYLLHPIVEKLHEKHLPRWAAVLLIYTLFFGGIGFALYKAYPILIRQIRDLSKNIPGFIDTYREWVYSLYEQTSAFPEALHDRMDELFRGIEKYAENMVTSVATSLTGAFDIFVIVAVIPVLVFYMLKDFPVMKNVLWKLTPSKYRKEGRVVLQEIDESLGSYIRGQLLVCLFVGVISIGLLWLIGMKYPLLLGSLMGITNIIPYFGPLFGAVPAVIIAFTISGKMVLFVIGTVLAVQLIESNLLSPFIVGKSLHMHPILIIFALLVGGEVGGVIGMILAVPVLTIIRVFIYHTRLYKKDR